MIVDRNENDILRVQSQQASLFGLLKVGIPTAEPAAAWRALTAALAETLGVQSASIWLLTPDCLRLRLVCEHNPAVTRRAQLEESEELFSRALRSSPDWISVVRMSDGMILHVNEAFERESGHSAAESIGRSTVELGMWVSAKERFENLVLYEAALDPYTHERLLLLSELAEGVRRGEIVAHFQPRVLLADGRVDGFEALAELSDSIRPLTMSMLDTALARQADWGPGVKVSVNLSARHLLDEGCPGQIRQALVRHRADASCLELEVTESALIHDPDRARHVLEAIAALGVRLSIDDFGTGYSSLSHLKRMPLNALRIDSSFVGPMLASSADHTILASTVALARSLGLGSIAEGIEDGATLEALRKMGCDEGQGFHIARPMEGDKATRWLQSRT